MIKLLIHLKVTYKNWDHFCQLEFSSLSTFQFLCFLFTITKVYIDIDRQLFQLTYS